MSPPFLMGAPFNSYAFEPSTVPWRGWWRAGDYVAASGTWNAAGSAPPNVPNGGSGILVPTRSLVFNNSSGGAPTKPTNGPALNGLQTVSFDGVANRLAATQDMNFFIAPNGVPPANAWTVAALFNIQALTSNNPNVWQNPMIVGDTSTFWGLYAQNVGGVTPTLHFMQWDGADKHVSRVCTLNTWILAYMSYNGVNITLDIGTGVASLAAGTLSNGTNNFRLGQALSNPTFQGYMAEVWSGSIFANVTRPQLVSYANARYGLALT